MTNGSLKFTHHILKTDLGTDEIHIVEDDAGAIITYKRDYKIKRTRRIAALVGKWRGDIWENIDKGAFREGDDWFEKTVINSQTGAKWPDEDFYWEVPDNVTLKINQKRLKGCD